MTISSASLVSQLFIYPWARHALIAALAVGILCSLLSVLIVLKRMAFIGQGISHAGFGGVGTAALLGFSSAAYQWQQDAIVLVFCLSSALLIGFLSRSRRVERDAAIGILLAGTMAWGVLAQNIKVELLLQSPAYAKWIGTASYSPPWEAIMFGSLLSVGWNGMIIAVGLCVAVLVLGAVFYKELVFFAFDESVSRVFGVPAAVLHYAILVVLALVVVVSIRLVGIILVSALLILPGSTALMVSRHMKTVLLLAIGTGIAGTVGGMVISFYAGSLTPGACISAVLLILFGVAVVYSRLGSGPSAARAEIKEPTP